MAAPSGEDGSVDWEDPSAPVQPFSESDGSPIGLGYHDNDARVWGAGEVSSGAAVHNEPSQLGEQSEKQPFMLDIMSGPNAPLCKAFKFCGWLAEPVDYLIIAEQDVADPISRKFFMPN